MVGLGLMNAKIAIERIARIKSFDPNTVASRGKTSSIQLFKKYSLLRCGEMALQVYT
jgi:predicted solute-binding protein